MSMTSLSDRLEAPASHRRALFTLLGLIGATAPFGVGCVQLPSGGPAPESTDIAAIRSRAIELEDARRDPEGELLKWLVDGRPAVRERAALALGRFTLADLGEPATEALTRALDDSAPRVRATAAFGLGLRGDAGVALQLVARWRDPVPDVRAALVEAATRLASTDVVPHVIDALRDPAPEVRAAAAAAAHRLPPLAPEQESALGLALSEMALRPTMRERRALAGFDARFPGGTAEPEDYDVVWRALFALQRRGSVLGRSAYLRWSDAESPFEARLFATRGLGRLELDPEVERALVARAADTDWRVAVEALRGIARLVRPEAEEPTRTREVPPTIVTSVAAALGHRSVHVRLVAWEALADLGLDAASHLFGRLADEDEPTVRAAAARTLLRLRGERALGEVRRLATSPDVIERSGAATALAELTSPAALALVLELTRDPHPRVAGAAVSSSTAHLAAGGEEPGAIELRLRLHAMLQGPDSALRLAAAMALREVVEPGDLAPLRIAALTSTGDGGPEARMEAARTLARLDDDAAGRVLERLTRDPDPYVARVALGLAAARGLDAVAPPVAEPPAPRAVPEFWRGEDPRVTFVTNRGELTFRLLPREAPVHVHSLLELVRAGAYDGTGWHRVVPSFVAQGGGGRGDGNGGGTWRGPDDALRLEPSRRGYSTGTLGMPRYEDPDSGGRQIFVTHRPTPHLDGRYTVFGELEAGLEVLMQLREGDEIVTARIDSGSRSAE